MERGYTSGRQAQRGGDGLSRRLWDWEPAKENVGTTTSHEGIRQSIQFRGSRDGREVRE